MTPRGWLLVIILGFAVLIFGGGMDRANQLDCVAFGVCP